MIKIIDNYFYDVDQFNYILLHVYEREKMIQRTRISTGQVITACDELGYFKNLESLLLRLTEILAKEKILAGEITTIQEHIQALKDIKAQLTDIIHPF